jgi:hypothetical protein
MAEDDLRAADEAREIDRARREGKLTVRTDMLMAAWGFGTPDSEQGLEERFESDALRGVAAAVVTYGLGRILGTTIT